MQKKVWFTSDHHFGHKNIIDYSSRPFASVAEMDEQLIKKWNSVIDLKDEVYHLGDFCLERDHKRVTKWVSQLNGKKHLIIGNHDEQFKARAWVTAGFYSVHTSYCLNVNGEDLWMGHYPQNKRDLKLRDVIYLHGHTHCNDPAIYLDEEKEVMVNLCVENWDYFPVEVSELFGKIESFKNGNL